MVRTFRGRYLIFEGLHAALFVARDSRPIQPFSIYVVYVFTAIIDFLTD